MFLNILSLLSYIVLLEFSYGHELCETLAEQQNNQSVKEEDSFLKPERIIRIAERLLKLTLNASHVQMSHCVMLPQEVPQQRTPTLHFHVNVISHVFLDMPIFVRKNITINLLKELMKSAGPNDLSLDCWSTDERPDGFLEEDLEHLKPYVYGEHIIQDIMEDEFNKTFMPSFFYVENVCEHYGIHKSHESHFQILIVSDKFEGKDLAERRYMVDEIVRRSMMHGIVRLFLKLFTEKEWAVEQEREKIRNSAEDRRLRRVYDDDELRDDMNMDDQ